MNRTSQSSDHSPSSPAESSPNGPARLVLLLAFGALVWLGLAQLQTPEVVSETAPPTAFSAERANAHLEVIATESRAIGTPGNRAARQYLVEQIEALGLEAEVQTSPAHVRFPGSPGFSAGVVHNVLTRVPGTDNTGAIAVNAHYDSGTTGPGASDCGSCVVTALEALRAVVEGPPLRNDVVFVFTDGEENGDLGAAAFVKEHPWADDVRLAINYEAQGSSGPAILYATSERDGWLVSEFFDVAPNVAAYSWIGAISEAYPSGQLECDLAEYMKGGIQGLGFVYTADTVDYHTARDSLEHIDLGSVQQEGDYTIAFLGHFGRLDLTDIPSEQNQVFFNVLPGVVAHYPYGWVVPMAAVLTVIGLLLIGVGFRREALHLKELAIASASIAVGTIVVVALCVLGWMAIKSLNPVYDVILIGHYQTELYTVAFIALAVALVGVLHALVRRLGTAHLLAAAVLVWLPLLWALSLTLPAMSYIATWPLLFALLPLAWLGVGARPSGWGYVAALVVAAVPAIVLLPGTLYQAVGLINRFEGATGAPLLGGLTLFVAPVLVLLMPHFEFLAGRGGRQRWLVPGVAGLLALGLVGGANSTAEFDETRPRPNHIAYTLDANSGEAEWVSFDRHLDDWTGTFFPADIERGSYETANWGIFDAFIAPAATVDIPGPEVELASLTADASAHTLAWRLRSPRGAPEMRVFVRTLGEITAAALDDRVLDLSEYAPADDGILRLNYVNVPSEGALLTITVASADEVRVTVEDVSLGLPSDPELRVEPRPAHTMPAPSFRFDATEVRKTRVFELTAADDEVETIPEGK
jgi:hypothetical protein